jgi:hypothetical protein
VLSSPSTTSALLLATVVLGGSSLFGARIILVLLSFTTVFDDFFRHVTVASVFHSISASLPSISSLRSVAVVKEPILPVFSWLILPSIFSLTPLVFSCLPAIASFSRLSSAELPIFIHCSFGFTPFSFRTGWSVRFLFAEW